MEIDDPIVPYRKKSKSRPPKKANHKHVWAYCVFEFSDERFEKVSVGTYCPICGKIGNPMSSDWRENTSEFDRYVRYDWTEAARKELCSETRTLPLCRAKNYFSKFVESKEVPE